jgi:Anti-sigma-K factor rskA/Putative zinc-finger
VSDRGHSRYEDDVGAYLLGALDDGERHEFERHLEGCARCAMDVARLRPATDALPRSVAQLDPPRGLKRSIMREVELEGEGEGEGEAPRRSFFERFLPRLPALRPAAALAGVAAALLVGLVVGLGLGRSGDDGERTVAARMDSARLPAASGSLSVPEDGSGGVLRVQGMPAPPSGRVYQAWVQRGGAMLPQPTFDIARDGSGAAALTEDLDDADAVLVTVEDRGGARSPSGKPMVSVKL